MANRKCEMKKKGEFPDIRNLKTKESHNASGMILHETRAMDSLRDIHRVLKNDGKIVIIDWVKGAKTWTHERYFSPEELEAVIKQRGFRSIRLDALNGVMLLIAEKS